VKHGREGEGAKYMYSSKATRRASKANQEEPARKKQVIEQYTTSHIKENDEEDGR
jgi:hypothetical protein